MNTDPICVSPTLEIGAAQPRSQVFSYPSLRSEREPGNKVGRGASFLYRNCAEITVLMCEQKPYLIWLSRRRKSYPRYSVNIGLQLRYNNCIRFSS